MSLFGAIAGQVIGSAIGSHFSRQNAQHSAGLALHNWHYQQSNAHQLEVQDLRNAGLNPILSATNSQIAGMGSAPSVTDLGMGTGIANSVNASSERKLQKEQLGVTEKIGLGNLAVQQTNAETASKKADADIIYANALADLTREKINTERSNNALVNENINKIRQDIENSIRQTDAMVSESNSRINLNYVQSDHIKNLEPWQINKLNLESQSLLAKLGCTEREIKLLDRTLGDMDFIRRQEYLKSWLGDKASYLGFFGSDLSRIVNIVALGIGR